MVTGRIQTGSYTNKDGNKVYTTDVIVEDQEFAESKAASDGRSGSYNNNGFGGFGGSSDMGTSVGDGFMNIPDGVEDEGLPFN